MKFNSFEDINAWQKAQELAIIIYKLTEGLNDFGFKNQITRAAISVSNNIAEGFDRGTNKEFIHFLYIARGSNSEVKSMTYLAIKLSIITEIDAKTVFELCDDTGKMLNGLINYLNKFENKTFH